MTFTRTHLRIGVLALWLGCMGWLVRYEAFPAAFDRMSGGGYRGLFSQDVLLMDSWMRILFNGAPIGFSHSSMELDEENPAARHVVRDHLQARLNLMGLEQKLYADAVVRLDDAYELQQFTFDLSAGTYALRLQAVRSGAETFRVTMSTGASTQTTTVTVPRDVVIYSPMTEMAMRRLSPGQSLTIRTLDPATLSTAPLTIRSLRREVVTVAGQTQEATLLATEYQGATVQTWMGGDGRVLRQETPFGWVLEACTLDEAVRAFNRAAPSADMLASLAVPCSGLAAARRADGDLTLRLTGVTFSADELRSHRQRVVSVGTNEAVVVLSPDRLPAAADGVFAPLPSDPDLASTLSTPADNPEIARRAAEITTGLTDPALKARAILDWVFRNVAKENTISLPSALDVLRTLKGDCNEHTVLFVALARAAGLPARTKVGLALHEGAFYYHAWPAVFTGAWHECDPTWGTPGVAAARLALAEGELPDQMRLAKVMGRLRMEAITGETVGRPANERMTR